MRTANAAFLAALAAAGVDGLEPRRFLWVRGVTRATPAVDAPIGLWTGDEDLTFSVIDGITGSTVSRLYYGMGISLQIPSIPRVSDLTIQTLAVEISQLNNINETMIRQNTVRFVKVDIHEGLISPTTGLLTSNPELVFLGEVDGDPIDTPSAGEEGSITLEIVSDAIRGLTRTNPAKRSDETQKLRSNDRINRYSNTMQNLDATWGE